MLKAHMWTYLSRSNSSIKKFFFVFHSIIRSVGVEMAWSKDVLRTSVLFLLFLNVPKIVCDEQSWITSFSIEEKQCSNEFCNFLLSVNGTDLENQIGFTTVPANRGCACVDIVSNVIHKVNNGNNHIKIALPVNGSGYYFCVEKSGKWTHQGADLYVMPSDVISQTKTFK